MATPIQHHLAAADPSYLTGAESPAREVLIDSDNIAKSHANVMPTFPRLEDRLLIHAARSWFDGASVGPGSILGRADCDWEYLVTTADRHCVLPLVHRYLSRTESEILPSSVWQRLRDIDQENARRNLFLTGELLKLHGYLRQEGIDAIPFKGPTLALSAYGDLGMRQFGDLDILIRKQDFVRLKGVLTPQNFKPRPNLTDRQQAASLRFDSAHNFENSRGLTLDVHWNFAERHFSLGSVRNQLWRRLVPTEVGRVQLSTLSTEDLILVLCLHGCTHFWERLGWICDVVGLIHRHRDIDWQFLLRLATDLGIQRIVLLGLFLAAKLMAAPIPVEVWNLIQSDPEVEPLAQQVEQRLFESEPVRPGVLGEASLQIRVRERKRDKLKSCLSLAMSPTKYDWMSVPLPDWLFFLYYPLRPFRLAGKYTAKLLR